MILNILLQIFRSNDMDKPIYVDYNDTTPVDSEVINAMMPHIQTNFANPSSAYSKK